MGDDKIRVTRLLRTDPIATCACTISSLHHHTELFVKSQAFLVLSIVKFPKHDSSSVTALDPGLVLRG